MDCKRLLWTYLLLFLLFENLFCIDNYLVGSRFGAMANCGVAIPDIWSVSHNQAGLGLIDKTQVGIFHEQEFLVKELSLSSLAAILPIKSGTFGLQLNYFGYTKYHEMKLGIGFGKKLGSKISVGVQLDYFSTFLPAAYSKQQSITVEVGLLSQPVEKLNLGFQIFNPVPKKSKLHVEQQLPTNARLGLAYDLRKIVLLSAETEFSNSEPTVFRAGIEYLIIPSLALRMGISNQETPLSFGLGYNTKKLNFNLAFTNHQQLGLTPLFDFAILF